MMQDRELEKLKKELTAAGLDPELLIKKLIGNKPPERYDKEYHNFYRNMKRF